MLQTVEDKVVHLCDAVGVSPFFLFIVFAAVDQALLNVAPGGSPSGGLPWPCLAAGGDGFRRASAGLPY